MPKSKSAPKDSQSNQQSSQQANQQSNRQSSEDPALDQTISSETISDVNQLDAFGGDRPARDLVNDESQSSDDDIQDSSFNR